MKLHLIFRLQRRKASRTEALGFHHTELIFLEAVLSFTALTGGPFSRNAFPVIQGLAVSTRRCSLRNFFFFFLLTGGVAVQIAQGTKDFVLSEFSK